MDLDCEDTIPRRGDSSNRNYEVPVRRSSPISSLLLRPDVAANPPIVAMEPMFVLKVSGCGEPLIPVRSQILLGSARHASFQELLRKQPTPGAWQAADQTGDCYVLLHVLLPTDE